MKRIMYPYDTDQKSRGISNSVDAGDSQRDVFSDDCFPRNRYYPTAISLSSKQMNVGALTPHCV